MKVGNTFTYKDLESITELVKKEKSRLVNIIQELKKGAVLYTIE